MNDSQCNLADIYAPIQSELLAVAERFDRELLSDVAGVQQLCDYLREFRGKMLRPGLVLLCARAVGSCTPEHITLAAVLEMIHIATLVHDDVLDEAQLRRRSPTLHAMSSNETAVLIGDYLISHAYHLCSTLPSPQTARTVAACTNTVCEGELLQVGNRENWNLTVQQYLTIITKKTAALTSLACRLGAEFAGADNAATEALAGYGLELGIAFQIVDDVLDIVGDEEEMGKTLGRDLDKGEFTLPIIHFLQRADASQREEFRSLCHRSDSSRAGRMKILLDGSLDHARKTAQDRAEAAMRYLDKLPDTSFRQSLIQLSRFILQRRA